MNQQSTDDEFPRAVSAAKFLFESLDHESFQSDADLAGQTVPAGIYLLYDNTKVVYVGRTRNVRKRIKDHRSSNYASATYAKRLARDDWHREHSPNKRVPNMRLADNVEFDNLRTSRREYVTSLRVKFLPCSDILTRYLLEAYAIVMLDLDRAELDTH